MCFRQADANGCGTSTPTTWPRPSRACSMPVRLPYHTGNDTSSSNTLNLAQDPGSATGFLNFMKSVQAAKNGTATFTSSSGHTSYGVLRMDIFGTDSRAIPNFFPPTQTRSLGVDETA